MTMMTSLQDRVVLEVFKKYEALPKKSKPGLDNNGKRQWVPLSGIVMSDEDSTELHCVAVATGMKCLPLSMVAKSGGCVLHDWHAEVLAIRLFNDFLLQEIRMAHGANDIRSKYIRKRDASELSSSKGLQPFTIKESMRVHMYCSEAPCGDASMELIMNAQKDPTPWHSERSTSDDAEIVTDLKGRGSFSELGIVRRKPARADCPSTLSKSCSDKIALKQCTSLLSAPVSLIISPSNAYISNLVLPRSQHVEKACLRAFSDKGRLQPLKDKIWPGGYSFRPFNILPTDHEFSHSRRASGPKSSNTAAAWNLHMHETLINGVLQGRKQSDLRGASAVCRRRIWLTAAKRLPLLTIPLMQNTLLFQSYLELKRSDMLKDRRTVKAEATGLALKGWIPNGNDDFAINKDPLIVNP